MSDDRCRHGVKPIRACAAGCGLVDAEREITALRQQIEAVREETVCEEIGPTSAMEGWRVTVSLWGQEVLGSEPESYGGMGDDVLDAHRPALHQAAACLLSFVGAPEDLIRKVKGIIGTAAEFYGDELDALAAPTGTTEEGDA